MATTHYKGYSKCSKYRIAKDNNKCFAEFSRMSNGKYRTTAKKWNNRSIVSQCDDTTK